MTKLLESLDSFIVEVEAASSASSLSLNYAIDLALVHLRLARSILNSVR